MWSPSLMALVALSVAIAGGFRIVDLRQPAVGDRLVAARAVERGRAAHPARDRRGASAAAARRRGASSLVARARHARSCCRSTSRRARRAAGRLSRRHPVGFPPEPRPWRIYSNDFLDLPARWDTGWYLGDRDGGLPVLPVARADTTEHRVLSGLPDADALPVALSSGASRSGPASAFAGRVFLALIYFLRLARE